MAGAVAPAPLGQVARLRVGHAAGNRHWDLAVRGSEALVPVPDSRERVRSAIGGDLPAGVTTRFESVPPTTFDDGHAPDHGHGEDGHTHDHAHGGDAHAHDHGGDGDGHTRSRALAREHP